jgi:thiamine-monophosphate kinase
MVTVGALGEHRIVELLKRHFAVLPDVVVGFGDDVAAVQLKFGEGEVAVLKTDMLVAKTDVPVGMTLWQAARKAVIAPVSDFGAKGALPVAVQVAVGFPSKFTQAQVEEVAEGLNSGAREYGAYVVGGDTAEASDFTVAVQVYGTAKRKTLMLRRGAQPDDILAVTGFFGKTVAGLQILQQTLNLPANLRQPLVDSVLLPKARLSEGLALAGSGAVSASMDSSDGLAWCLHELAMQGNVGFVVSDLPVAPEAAQFAKLQGVDVTDLVLFGGEEYELVITVKPELWAAAEAAVASAGGKLLPIGKATKETKIMLNQNDVERPIEPKGYEHFKT